MGQTSARPAGVQAEAEGPPAAGRTPFSFAFDDAVRDAFHRDRRHAGAYSLSGPLTLAEVAVALPPPAPAALAPRVPAPRGARRRGEKAGPATAAGRQLPGCLGGTRRNRGRQS